MFLGTKLGKTENPVRSNCTLTDSLYGTKYEVHVYHIPYILENKY